MGPDVDRQARQRGNGSVQDKVMNTKFPMSALVMEWAFTLSLGGLRSEEQWSPQETHQEADLLANSLCGRTSIQSYEEGVRGHEGDAMGGARQGA